MGRRHTVMIAGALLATAVCSEHTRAATVRWGPRAGVNASTVAGEYADVLRNQDVRAFPNVGVAVELELASFLAFRGEAAYSEKGTASSWLVLDGSGNLAATYEARWRFQYLEIPLLLRSRIELGAGVSPYFEVGPSFAATLGGTVDSRIVPGPFVQDALRVEMSDMDFGVASGFGVEVPAGSGRLGLEVRYTHGLTNIWNHQLSEPVYNQTWTFAVSWLN